MDRRLRDWRILPADHPELSASPFALKGILADLARF